MIVAGTPGNCPPHANSQPAARHVQRVTCHVCGHQHLCADHAENTQCPHCGQAIVFHDVVIASQVSRSIDTRGTLRVEPGGSLFTPRTICRDAVIHGALSGQIYCENRISLHGHGNYPVKIETHELIVHAGAEVSCPFPIRAKIIHVRGSLRAPLLVEGDLHVHRKGHVLGAVCARSVHVDRGGELRGQVRISTAPLPGTNSTKGDFPHQLRPQLAPRHRNRRPIYLPTKIYHQQPPPE